MFCLNLASVALFVAAVQLGKFVQPLCSLTGSKVSTHTISILSSFFSHFFFRSSYSPLDLQSWLKYLIPDCYKLVCSALGCSETSTAAQVEAEIALSLQTEALGRSRANSFREGAVDLHDTHSSNNHSISSKKLLHYFPKQIVYLLLSLRLVSVKLTPVSLRTDTPRRSMSMASVADGILTPLSARMRTIAESTAPDEYAEAMAQLTPCKCLHLYVFFAATRKRCC